MPGLIFIRIHRKRIRKISVAKDGLNIPETENEKKVNRGNTYNCRNDGTLRTDNSREFPDIKNIVDCACLLSEFLRYVLSHELD